MIIFACCAPLLGCSAPLEMTDPELTGAAAETCGKVMAELPETVAGQSRRSTEPGRWTAAWGDPAITLICGAPLPASVGPDAQCFEVNDVGWYAQQADQDWSFITLGREVVVQVTVPVDYAPEADALVDLAQTVGDHNKSLQPCI